MPIRANEGWIRAGLAVLVTGVLGGGVVTVARDSGPRKVTAGGVTRTVTDPTGPVQAIDLATTPAAATEDKPKADPAVGDKIMVGGDGGSVTVSAVEDDVSAGRLFGAGEGHKYIAAEVKGCSGPHEKDLTFDPSYFMLLLDDGTMHDRGPGAKKPELEGGAVPAGKCLSGWVTFTVPDGALAKAVQYDGSSRLTWTVPLPKGAHPTTTTTAKGGATTTSTTSTAASPTTSTTVRSAKVAASTSTSTTTTTTKAKTTTTTTRPATTATTTSAKPTTSTTSTTKPPASSTTSTTSPTSPTTGTTAATG